MIENTRMGRGQHLSRRLLRTLVPASLAGGIMALYPAISGSVVDRLGAGFEPKLVALYVSTLLLLFFVDSWARDRRLAEMARAADLERLKAEGSRQRAEELHFILDVAKGLDGQERIESPLFSMLERLREKLGITEGFVFLRDPASGITSCRGIYPLTGRADPAVHRFADRALAVAASADIMLLHSDPGFPGLIACPIQSRGNVIGLIILRPESELGADDQARLLAIADRLGASLNGLLLLSELEKRERSLRHAYRELRLNGSRCARSSAEEEAAIIGRAGSDALEEPVSEARAQVRALDRALPGQRYPAVRDLLEQLRGSLDQIGSVETDLRSLGQHVGQPESIQVNDALVAALDLALPDLKRAGIEIRLSLDSGLEEIRMDEALLVQLLLRLLRRARASLRRAIEPRILSLRTSSYGAGVRITFKDNSAGLSTPGMVVRKSSEKRRASRFQIALRRQLKEQYRTDLAAQGISIQRDEKVGQGRTITVCLRGVAADRESATSDRESEREFCS
ncbi:MAG: hypothetical protein V2A76_09280 [Planctomycetota bacterium]